jgi:hypothetical protein
VIYRIDETEVRRALELLSPPVFEVRALNALVDGDRYRGQTFRGYYDREHFDSVIADLRRITAASAVYFTPNCVKRDLLARCFNRAEVVRDERKQLTTADKDIAERNWLLIDVDAVKPAGISSTAAEKAAAEGLATAIDHWLWERGFPPGVIGDSGNGAHVMIPVRLPADDGGWCKRLLNGLAKEFDTQAATVDVTVFNAARIWKLPGTLVCKGDHAPEIGREWRMSKILSVCTEVVRNG